MSVRVKFLASLRERVGREEEEVEIATGTTAADLWHTLCPALAMPPNTLVAINYEYSAREAVVRDGDEVAFFPPVTGG